MAEHRLPRRRIIKPWYRRGWVITLITVGILVVALLALLPFGISYGLKNWMQANGATQVAIEDVDFNPFTGTLAVRGLSAPGANQTDLKKCEPSLSGARLQALAKKRAQVVKSYLIREKSISAKRLIACRSQVERPEQTGKARTDLLL